MLFGAPRSCIFKSLQGSPESLKEFMLTGITSMVLYISYSTTNLRWSHDTASAFLIVLGQEQTSSRAQISDRWIDWKLHKCYCYDPTVCQGTKVHRYLFPKPSLSVRSSTNQQEASTYRSGMEKLPRDQRRRSPNIFLDIWTLFSHHLSLNPHPGV